MLVKISSNAVDDLDLRTGEALAIDVGAVGEQRQHALGAELGEAVQVEVLAVDRRLVDLEVAGVDASMPAGVVIASATQSGMLCVTRMNSIVNGPIVTVSRGLTVLSRSPGVDAVLLELRLDQRQRHRRAVDRAVEERHHVRHGADVVLVAVRQHERLDLARRAPRRR